MTKIRYYWEVYMVHIFNTSKYFGVYSGNMVYKMIAFLKETMFNSKIWLSILGFLYDYTCISLLILAFAIYEIVKNLRIQCKVLNKCNFEEFLKIIKTEKPSFDELCYKCNNCLWLLNKTSNFCTVFTYEYEYQILGYSELLCYLEKYDTNAFYTEIDKIDICNTMVNYDF